MNTNARAAERGGERVGSGRMRGVLHDAEKSGKSGARGARELFRFARHVARVDPASSRSTDWSAFSPSSLPPLHLRYPALSPLRRPPQGRPLL